LLSRARSLGLVTTATMATILIELVEETARTFEKIGNLLGR